MDLEQLYDALDSVTAIPVVPYKDGRIDYAGHARNVEYLMANNYLDNDRPRVVSVAGTSLIHHMSPEETLRITEITGQAMGSEGLLLSSIVPNPIAGAGWQIEAQSALQRSPDVYLIMPLGGTSSPDGVYTTFMEFGERYGESVGARFLYYYRNPRDREAVVRLLNDSPHFVGVKIGTGVDDVAPFIDDVGDNAMVIWGIGDRSTNAAKLGARGHTSGITLVCPRACDGINNAQRRGDYAAAYALEEAVTPLEEIRFRNGRMYNYAAVVEAILEGGFDDVVGGEGGPFNPRVPVEVRKEVRQALESLSEYR